MKQVFLRRFTDLKFYLSLLILSIVFQFCSSESLPNKSVKIEPLFKVEGSQILKENLPVFYKGVNALQTYGLGNAELMDQWNIEIVREFIGNFYRSFCIENFKSTLTIRPIMIKNIPM